MKNGIYHINLVKNYDIKYKKVQRKKLPKGWNQKNEDKNIVCLFIQMLAQF